MEKRQTGPTEVKREDNAAFLHDEIARFAYAL
jgi:hypothetical protein